jgi:hypothetical protein
MEAIGIGLDSISRPPSYGPSYSRRQISPHVALREIPRRLSDMSNLSWAKNAVLIAAERELEWEARDLAAIDPRKCP